MASAIYRLTNSEGKGIQGVWYPTTQEEVAALAKYVLENPPPFIDGPHPATLDCPSSICNTVAAMNDERFNCPDTAHRGYDPNEVNCPTCHESWIYTEERWPTTRKEILRGY
jgi:hypothetical protein